MVNYHDPVTIAREFSTYAVLQSFSGLQPSLPVGRFNRGDSECLAPREWYIHVSLPVLPLHTASGQARLDWLTRDLPILAGNSSPPFTMSGM